MLKKTKSFSQKSLLFLLLFALLYGFASCKNSCPQGETFKVAFDAMGGEPEPETIIVPLGSKIKEPEGIKYSYYSLSGWYKEQDLKNSWDFENDIVLNDLTLYAKWTIGGGGSGSSSGRTPVSTKKTGTSNYTQTILYKENISSLPGPGTISIQFTHTNSTGPQPVTGDLYSIEMDGGLLSGMLSTGTIKIDTNGDIIFIPDSGMPFIGELHNSVLSIDEIPPNHISVPGAVIDLNDGHIEGNELAAHPHVPPELDDFATSHSNFDAETITFKNWEAPVKLEENWITKYETGYYGWKIDDMVEFYGTEDPALSSATPETGKAILGEWKKGGSTPLYNLHVEIKETQKNLLQFSKGGAPLILELDDDYGTGSPVGYIEITSSGQTNIVTLRLHLDSNYTIAGPAEVEWASPTNPPGSRPDMPFKVPKVDTTYVYTNIPSNSSFKGATFSITTNKNPELLYTGAGSNLYFVDTHNEIIVKDPPHDNTVHGPAPGYTYDDHTLPTPKTENSTGWIFEHCIPGDEYYKISGPPDRYVAKSQVIEYSSNFYVIEDGVKPPPAELFYYSDVTGKYYQSADFSSYGFPSTLLLVDGGVHVPGPTFVPDVSGTDIKFHHENAIVHAVQNFDLFVNDIFEDVPVGTVHVEYNRFEPDDTTGIPYMLLVTYYFDDDFMDIIASHSLIYTCTVNGIPVSHYKTAPRGNTYTVNGMIGFNTAPGEMTFTVDTHFYPYP